MVSNMKIGFIGAGKVGFSLGKYFAGNGLEISGYFSRSESSAREAAAFTGTDFFMSAKKLILVSDAVFLTVPDDEIKNTYLSLPIEQLRGKKYAIAVEHYQLRKHFQILQNTVQKAHLYIHFFQ